MKKILLPLLVTIILFSCNSKKNIPDVSSIKVNIETKRFEQDFFAIDTVNVAESIKMILQKYPHFTPDFVENILGLDMDSLLILILKHHLARKAIYLQRMVLESVFNFILEVIIHFIKAGKGRSNILLT